MEPMLVFGLFNVIYGILGLFGVQNIAQKYRGKPWTRAYIRCCGLADLMLGIPWTVFYFILRDAELTTRPIILIFLGLALPCLIYTVWFERKFRARLKQEVEHL